MIIRFKRYKQLKFANINVSYKKVKLGQTFLASPDSLLVCETTRHIKAWIYIESKIRHLLDCYDSE